MADATGNLNNYENITNCAEELLTMMSAGNQELSILEQIYIVEKQIQDILDKQKQQIKNDIEALSNFANEEAEKTSQNNGLQELVQKEEAIQREITDAKQHLDKICSECDSTELVLEKKVKEKQRLGEERERIQKETNITLPKTRHDINLYSNITKIRWQFHGKEDEIKGYVCNKDQVKPFTLNKQKVSSFFISNYLWDLIEEDW